MKSLIMQFSPATSFVFFMLKFPSAPSSQTPLMNVLPLE